LSAFSISFLARPGCHLCDEARPLILWAAAKEKVAVVEVDVDRDDELLGVYGLRIPVVLGSNRDVLAEGVIDDRRAMRRSIRKAAKSQPE